MRIRDIAFDRKKYGPELMVDIGWVCQLKGIVLDDEPHRLDFYDLLLVTRGRGSMLIDDVHVPLRPRQLVVTSPGQVRRLFLEARERRIFDGIVLFFLGPFALDFFNDARFLHRLHFFHSHRTGTTLRLSERRCAWFEERLETMRCELSALQGDSQHMLRAVLYEVLIRVNRWYAEALGMGKDTRANPVVYRFLQLLDEVPTAHRNVAWYARRLGLSTTHLRNLTRQHLGVPPGALVRLHLVTAAKRQLLFTHATSAAIGSSLGFEDPAYFSRFFRRETGTTPSSFREQGRGGGGTSSAGRGGWV